jgi:hypothetical protein
VGYISILKSSHVGKKEEKYEWNWLRNLIREYYTHKLRYKVLCEIIINEEPMWWWKKIWKYKCSMGLREILGKNITHNHTHTHAIFSLISPPTSIPMLCFP